MIHSKKLVTSSRWAYQVIRVEPTSAHRYFGVDLFRKDGQLLGLRIDQQNGSWCVGDIDGGPAAEWNRNCDKTFPDDKLEKGDLIIRVNGIGVGKSTNVNGRTKILDAMPRRRL